MAYLNVVFKDGTLCDNSEYRIDDKRIVNLKNFNQIPYSNFRGFKEWRKNFWLFLHRTLEITQDALGKSKQNLTLIGSGEYEHNTSDSFFDVRGAWIDCFTLKTGNVVGYISQGNHSIKISSRFGDRFLKYIISDADGFLEIKDFGGENQSNFGYEWLLVYLWMTKLKKAYRLGVPKKYVNRRDWLGSVRGRLDVIDYALNCVPGKILCNYREHNYDKDVAHLFCACYESVQKANPFVQENLRSVYQVFKCITEGERRSFNKLISTPYISNPYYAEYNTVIDWSKRLLKKQTADFSDKENCSAFLFDVSMLFEYFIRKLIGRMNVQMHSKFDGVLKIPTGVGSFSRKLEPDLFFEKNGKRFLFDVKYKNFDFVYGVSREDLFQLHTYIGQYSNASGIDGCGFIYPISEEKWGKNNLDETSGVVKQEIIQQDRKIPFYVVFLKVPNDDENFYSNMRQSCDVFESVISSL